MFTAGALPFGAIPSYEAVLQHCIQFKIVITASKCYNICSCMQGGCRILQAASKKKFFSEHVLSKYDAFYDKVSCRIRSYSEKKSKVTRRHGTEEILKLFRTGRKVLRGVHALDIM